MSSKKDMGFPHTAPSYEALVSLAPIANRPGLEGQMILWGGWARWFTSRNTEESLKDVDVILSRYACLNFYELVLGLLKAGFLPVWKLADRKLEDYLCKEGVTLDSYCSSPGHGLSWRYEKDLTGLDLAFDPSGIQVRSSSYTNVF